MVIYIILLNHFFPFSVHFIFIKLPNDYIHISLYNTLCNYKVYIGIAIKLLLYFCIHLYIFALFSLPR